MSRTQNNTTKNAPNDIAQLDIGDFRPNKALYVNVQNNNDFRLYLQRNANQIRQEQQNEFIRKFGECNNEKQAKGIVPFIPGYPCQK